MTSHPSAQDKSGIPAANIALQDVTRVYAGAAGEKVHAVGPLTLELRRGEFFAVVGPSGCAGGMRQRVCIARTLVLRPRLILLDEPFAALDQQTRLLMGDELLRVWRDSGATILLITHALDEAAMLADRIAVMSARPGRILEIVETRWPRDRDSQIVAAPSFGEITGRLWRLLRGESLKALGKKAGEP